MTEAFKTTAHFIYFDELFHDFHAFLYRFFVFLYANGSKLQCIAKHVSWPRRDSNTQPSDLESDALPLRHGVHM